MILIILIECTFPEIVPIMDVSGKSSKNLMKITDVHNLNNKMLNIEDNHCDILGIWSKSQVNPLISQIER